MKQFDLVHIHGIWSWKLHQVAVLCRKSGVPYVIAPRGMLEPWSPKQKWLKKRIARWLYQDRDLKLAEALHATAESEAGQFRKLGFKNRIIVSPNGVNVPEGDSDCLTRRERDCKETPDGNRTWTVEFSNKKELTGMPTTGEAATVEVTHLKSPSTHTILKMLYAVNGAPRRALFVSRMHPKKGVLELVEAWARLKHSSNPNIRTIEQWSCELVYTMNSEEERAYEQRVKQRVHELGLDDQFVFTGALDDEKKWEAYGRADLFVLPTYSENFGIVVAEALWAGVPVITTKGTPWKDLEDHKCGWWIDLPSAEVKVNSGRLLILHCALQSNSRTIRTIDNSPGNGSARSPVGLEPLHLVGGCWGDEARL